MKKTVCVLLTLFILLGTLVGCGGGFLNPGNKDPWSGGGNATDEEDEGPYDPSSEKAVYDETLLNEYRQTYDEAKKINSLALLNYFSVKTQSIITCKNNRIYLESLYSELVNNINPETVDPTTRQKVLRTLDTLEDLRMLDVKRERLQFLFEREQAQAIKKAIPDASQMLNVVLSGDYIKAIASATLMAVNSVSSYQSSMSEAELNFLKNQWDLDDQEAKTIHENVKDIVEYTVKQVEKFELKGTDTLNLGSIEKFAKALSEENVNRRLAFLLDNKNTYRFYGEYWLALAECYYSLRMYKSCYEAVRMYEGLDQQQIFRKDRSFAQMVPKCIVSLSKIGDTEFLAQADGYLTKMLDNIENDDWQLRYFAASVYMNLYHKTNDEKYLVSSKDQLRKNIVILSAEQQSLNEKYLNEVELKTVPADATKSKKEEIEAYNDACKENRKTELPPISEPLFINLDLLLAIGDMSASEKTELRSILGATNKPVFLNQQLDISLNLNLGVSPDYWSNIDENAFASISTITPPTFKWWQYVAYPVIGWGAFALNTSYNGGTVEIPASLLSSESVVEITIQKENGEIDNLGACYLKEVNRDGDFLSFKAVYGNDNATTKKYDYEEGMIVVVTAMPYGNIEPYVTKYSVKKEKKYNVFGFEFGGYEITFTPITE